MKSLAGPYMIHGKMIGRVVSDAAEAITGGISSGAEQYVASRAVPGAEK